MRIPPSGRLANGAGPARRRFRAFRRGASDAARRIGAWPGLLGEAGTAYNRRGGGAADRRRAGDGAVVPPPRRGGEDGSPACARPQPRAGRRIPRQPGLHRAASRRLAGAAAAREGRQCGSRRAPDLGGRFGPGGPKRRVRGRAPLMCRSKGSFSLYRRGCFSPGLVQSRRVWGGPGAGSRYHCSAVAAAEVRSRRAAGSGPLRAGRPKRRAGQRGWPRATAVPRLSAGGPPTPPDALALGPGFLAKPGRHTTAGAEGRRSGLSVIPGRVPALGDYPAPRLGAGLGKDCATGAPPRQRPSSAARPEAIGSACFVGRVVIAATSAGTPLGATPSGRRFRFRRRLGMPALQRPSRFGREPGRERLDLRRGAIPAAGRPVRRSGHPSRPGGRP